MPKAVKVVWLVALFLLANLGLVGMALAQGASSAQSSASLTATPAATIQLHGTVVDATGVMAGATVRVQATDNQTTSAEDGSFALDILSGTPLITITASAVGYYIGWKSVVPDLAASRSPITITLDAHFLTDNFKYDWFIHNGLEGSQA